MEWRIGSLSCNIYTRDLSFSCFLSNLRYKTLVALFVAMQAFNVQSVCGYTLGGPQPKSKNQVPWKHTCWIKTLIICWSFYLQNNYNQLQFNDHLFLRIPTMRCSFEKKKLPQGLERISQIFRTHVPGVAASRLSSREWGNGMIDDWWKPPFPTFSHH